MLKLPRTYRLLTFVLFLLGLFCVGIIYYYRDFLFKKFTEVVSPRTYTHAYLKPVDFKVDSQWLKNINYIRDDKVLLPANFDAVIFASNLNTPSKLAIVDNYVLVTERSTGNLSILEDSDYDNSANSYVVFDSGLQNPNGISFYNNDIYLACENSLVLYKDILKQITQNDSIRKVLVDLPQGGNNNLKNLIVNKNGIYVSIGSTCDKCIEQNKKRAAVVHYDLNGEAEELYATGLRNVGGMIEVGPSIVVTENSIGDTAHDEINVLRKNGFYGWPYFIDKNSTSGLSPQEANSLNPLNSEFELDPKANPMGLSYLEGQNEGNGALFVVLQGKSQIQKIAFFEQQSNFDDFLILPDSTKGPKPQLNDIKRFRNGFLITDSARGLIYFVYPK